MSHIISEFRLNKFCGEHLLIGIERDKIDEFSIPSQRKGRRGEPVAEARIQSDQSFHHLKILKSGEANDSHGPTNTSPNHEKDKKRRKNQQVYSQVNSKCLQPLCVTLSIILF